MPWCRQHGVRFIKEFDDPVTVRQFFNSWISLQPVKGKTLQKVKRPVGLRSRTKRAELQRFRKFLGFCQSCGWIKNNWALREPVPNRKGLHVEEVDVEQKFAWTPDEYAHIVKTLEDCLAGGNCG